MTTAIAAGVGSLAGTSIGLKENAKDNSIEVYGGSAATAVISGLLILATWRGGYQGKDPIAGFIPMLVCAFSYAAGRGISLLFSDS